MKYTKYTQVSENCSDLEGQSTCYLLGMQLREYLCSLPDDYEEYDIQRGIISNGYLDSIDIGVIEGKHIPPITLVTSKITAEEIVEFKILDGLQRTFKIKKLFDLCIKLEKLDSDTRKKVNDSIDNNNLREFKNLVGNIFKLNGYQITKGFKLFECLLKKYPMWNFSEIFDREQWFEVWYNLSVREQVNKMIILNAGHKPMSVYHQLELLFLNNLEYIKKNHSNFRVIRGKEKTPAMYSKDRTRNEFYYPHIIECMLSYLTREPIKANSGFVQRIQHNNLDDSNLIISSDLVDITIKILSSLDEKLSEEFQDAGIKWISKDTVLTPIFARIGEEQDYENVINIFIENARNLNITQFEEVRSNFNISSINIGDFTRELVSEGIEYFLSSNGKNKVDWEKCMENISKENLHG